MKIMTCVRGSIEKVQLTFSRPKSNHSPILVTWVSPRIILSNVAADQPKASDLLTNTSAMSWRQFTKEDAAASSRKFRRGRSVIRSVVLRIVTAERVAGKRIFRVGAK